ncbi:MAG: DUF5710 domain-containing protein [Actinomycetota bacterium]|nr:DUF5710 domain-containing protein [Actinomycetota bacterium]
MGATAPASEGEDGRTWPDVPFSDKDAAKAAGAPWDAQKKAWYAPPPGIAALEHWISRPPLNELEPSYGHPLRVGPSKSCRARRPRPPGQGKPLVGRRGAGAR